jgi:hypothetical protein
MLSACGASPSEEMTLGGPARAGAVMKHKGVSYDVGRVMGFNWRPDFDPQVVHRELEIIKNDLHCNAVRICGRNIRRLMTAAEDALKQGLEVWLSPEMWEKSPQETLTYITKAATAAERLRERWPEAMVLSVGSELTLFMKGIVEGRTFLKRLRNPALQEIVKSGKHNQRLNAFLARTVEAVRKVFHGKLTYASLIWEQVDWSLFDFIGVDHYRPTKIKDRYVEMLQPLLALGKPVVVTEFGCRTFQGAEEQGVMGLGVVDVKTLALHQIPLLGRFVRPRLKGLYVRDESLQAREIVETLGVIEAAGADGAFIMTFVSPHMPYDEEPLYDLDMNDFCLVKTYSHARHGATYPDMTWEPKEAFRAVAGFYAAH